MSGRFPRRAAALRRRGFAFAFFANMLLMLLLRKSAVYALLFAFLLLLPSVRPRLRLSAAMLGACACYFVFSLALLPTEERLRKAVLSRRQLSANLPKTVTITRFLMLRA